MSTTKRIRSPRQLQALQLVIRTGEQVFTTSLLVAEKFNKRHNIVMRSIRKLECSEEFSRCNFAPSTYIDDRGKEQPSYQMTKDGFIFLAMGFTGKEAAEWKEKFIGAFNFMEKELVRLYTMRTDTNWQKVRYDTKEAFKLVALVLQETRKLQGKETETHHYTNEARLMNGVLTGTFQGLSRDDLTDLQLKTLDAIQRENSRLLIQGVPYADRKQALLNLFIPKLH